MATHEAEDFGGSAKISEIGAELDRLYHSFINSDMTQNFDSSLRADAEHFEAEEHPVYQYPDPDLVTVQKARSNYDNQNDEQQDTNTTIPCLSTITPLTTQSHNHTEFVASDQPDVEKIGLGDGIDMTQTVAMPYVWISDTYVPSVPVSTGGIDDEISYVPSIEAPSTSIQSSSSASIVTPARIAQRLPNNIPDTYAGRRTAAGRRNFPRQCGACGKRYLHEDSAIKHYRTHHGPEPHIILRYDAPRRPLAANPRPFYKRTIKSIQDPAGYPTAVSQRSTHPALNSNAPLRTPLATERQDLYQFARQEDHSGHVCHPQPTDSGQYRDGRPKSSDLMHTVCGIPLSQQSHMNCHESVHNSTQTPLGVPCPTGAQNEFLRNNNIMLPLRPAGQRSIQA